MENSRSVLAHVRTSDKPQDQDSISFTDTKLELLKIVLFDFKRGLGFRKVASARKFSRLELLRFIDSFHNIDVGSFIVSYMNSYEIFELFDSMSLQDFYVRCEDVTTYLGGGIFVHHEEDLLELIREDSGYPACVFYSLLPKRLEFSDEWSDYRFFFPAWALEKRRIPALRDDRESRKAQAILALQEAATQYYPLSGKKYEELLLDGLLVGPPRQSIIKLFGTWVDACQTAGVDSGTRPRRTYDLKWTNKEAMSAINDCFRERGSFPSLQYYENWRQGKDVASAQTLKNRFGGWKQVEDVFHEWKRTGNA